MKARIIQAKKNQVEQERLDRQNTTGRTSHPDGTDRTGQAERDMQNGTGRTGKKEWNRQNRIGRIEQAEHDRQNRKGKT
jgi:hypothetical protein